MLAEMTDLSAELHDDGLGILGVTKVKNVLNDVVSKSILDELGGVGGDLLDKLVLLVAGSVVDAALEDTAAMAVSTDNNAIFTNSIKNELGIIRLQSVQTFLDDMVAVKVLDELDDLLAEGIDDDIDLEKLVDVELNKRQWTQSPAQESPKLQSSSEGHEFHAG